MCYDSEDTRYTEECEYCNGNGWQSAGWGDTRQYTCPDCGGSGEICRCNECDEPIDTDIGYCEHCYGKCEVCGEIFLREDLENGLCPECIESCAEEENEHKQAVNA